MSVERFSQVFSQGSSLGSHTMELFSPFAAFILCFKLLSFNLGFFPFFFCDIFSFCGFFVLHVIYETLFLVFCCLFLLTKACLIILVKIIDPSLVHSPASRDLSVGTFL